MRKKSVQQQRRLRDFTLQEELLEKLKQKGVELAFITLHVGLGTFRPVSADTIEEHHMHAEYYHMSKETALN